MIHEMNRTYFLKGGSVSVQDISYKFFKKVILKKLDTSIYGGGFGG